MTLRSLPDRYRVIDELWRDKHAVLYHGEDRHAQQGVIIRLPTAISGAIGSLAHTPRRSHR